MLVHCMYNCNRYSKRIKNCQKLQKEHIYNQNWSTQLGYRSNRRETGTKSFKHILSRTGDISKANRAPKANWD